MRFANVVVNGGAKALDEEGKPTGVIIPFGSCGDLIDEFTIQGTLYALVEFEDIVAVIEQEDLWISDAAA